MFIPNYDVSGYLNLRLNPDYKCWEVKIIDQNIVFFIDDVDRNIITSPAVKIQYNNETGDIECVTNESIIKLDHLIMQQQIATFVNTTGDVNFVVNHLNNIKLDYRRCNLVVDHAITMYDDQYDNIDYIGVYRSRSNKSWAMRIRNPFNGETVINYYDTPLEAAMSYDFYANQFYPTKIGVTNYELGKYSQDILDYYRIRCRSDIKCFPPKSRSHTTSTNELGFYGGFRETKYGIAMTFRALDENGRRRVVSYAKDSSELIDAVIKREEFILDHNSASPSNAIYPKEYYEAKEKGIPLNKKIIAGILVTIDENPNSPSNKRERAKKMEEEFLGKFKQHLK